MTVGNVLALRQTNIVRMLAYSSDQPGRVHPDAAGRRRHRRQRPNRRCTAVVVYLLVYAATNLGAFAVVIAVARKTRSGEISSYGGLFSYAPGLGVLMTLFMASLAGIPPLGGWFAKFGVVQGRARRRQRLGLHARRHRCHQLGDRGGLLRHGHARDVDEAGPRSATSRRSGRRRRCRLPCASPAVATIVLGVLPGLIGRYGDLTDLTGAFGG